MEIKIKKTCILELTHEEVEILRDGIRALLNKSDQEKGLILDGTYKFYDDLFKALWAKGA